MQPEIDLGPLTLQTFGICFALAFLASGALVARRLRELGKPVDWAYEIDLRGPGRRARRLARRLPGPELGQGLRRPARQHLLGRRASSGSAGSSAARSACSCGRAGAASSGCELLDAVRRPRSRSATRSGGSAASSRATATTASRRTCPGRWPTRTARCPTTDEVHPTPVYETLAMGLVALLLWHLRDRFRPGVLFALYLVLAGLERLLVEFIRRNDAVVVGLTQPQLISVAMMLAGRRSCAAAARRRRAP